MNRTFLLLPPLVVALFSSCKKEDGLIQIPDADEFHHSVTASLNGKQWYAYMNWRADVYLGKDTAGFSFFVIRNGVLREQLSIDWMPLKVGIYSIRERPKFLIDRGNYAEYYTLLADGDLAGEIYDSSADTAFHFFALDKYDPVKQEVEGRFQVELIKDPSRDFFDTPDTLRFTNGRFKLRVR